MSDTKERLLRATAEIIGQLGLSAATARAIGDRAEVNQALVFYHFGTVSELIEQASNQAVREAIDRYRDRFDHVTSLSQLLQVGRDLNQHEHQIGNVAMMGQLMANAARDPGIARAAQRAMNLWVDEIEKVLTRLMATSPLSDLVDPHGLSCAVTASFIGMELYETVDADESALAMGTLVQLAVLVDALNDLGPVATRALKSARRVTGLKTEKMRVEGSAL